MIFEKLKISGAYLIKPEFKEDDRGFFGRTFCQNEFKQIGLNPIFVQCNLVMNKRRGTLRGIKFQTKPHEESKLIRILKGSNYEVLVDLRPKSPTFKEWVSIELDSGDRNLLYVPEGVGHGYQTLEDKTEVFYQVSEFYSPDNSSGIRWNDPTFNIKWPIEDRIISQADQNYPNFC